MLDETIPFKVINWYLFNFKKFFTINQSFILSHLPYFLGVVILNNALNYPINYFFPIKYQVVNR